MANSTATYWDVNGTSLQTYAWNISTLGGSRSGVPPLRGSNRALAYFPGQQWRPKVPDQRTLSLAMWVLGSDANGVAPPAGSTQEIAFTANLAALQALFWSGGHGEQITLTKRWRTQAGVQSASALAELAGTLEPEMTGPYRGTLVVDLLLADPFFYGATPITGSLAV